MTTDEMLAGYAFAVVAATFICAVTAFLRDVIDKWVEKWTDTWIDKWINKWIDKWKEREG